MAPRRQLRFDPIDEARRQWIAHGWSDAAPGMANVTSIMRAEQILLARADDILRPFKLTFSRYEVLMLLLFSKRQQLPLGKVGERLQVGAASVTNAIDRLEASGLVLRQTNPADGRGVLGCITAEGKRLALAATAELNAALFEEVDFPTREMNNLFKLLRTIRRSAGDFK
jgi:DNA-binding MarR family transcriptional regulator